MTKKENSEIKLAVKAIKKAADGYNQSKMYDYYLFYDFEAEKITELVFDYIHEPLDDYNAICQFFKYNNLSNRKCLVLICRKSFENFLLNLDIENEND